MRKISDNYLFLNKQSDFTQTLLQYFHRRLGIFLCLNLDDSPKVLFTSNENKIYDLYNNTNEVTDDNHGRAFYDEVNNTVVFDAKRYDKKSESFFLESQYDEIRQLNGNVAQYKYIVPLSDIYHELIHSVQYQYDVYQYNDMVEATDELLTYFITGQYNIDYKKATMALWYIAKYILKLKKNRFYVFIRDSVVDPNFPADYYMTNKSFVRMLAKTYNGDFKKFMERFKIDLYYPECEQEFEADIQYIHNLIFYKY